MVSMATQYATLKNEGVPTKYSYLSSNSSYNTKLGTILIPGHSSFILLFDMQII